MILDAILLFASHVPSLNIEWVHIGGGNELSYYQSIAKLKSLPNAEIKFLGDLSGINLIQYIKSRPVDVFVNSSSSEGLSLALMEALSMGIPLIATRVGGNIELMSNENGILLPQSASAVDLADAFQYFIENPKEIEQWRINSRLCWEKHFNATKNFAADHGQNGMGDNKHGKNGQDLILRMPPGTQIFDGQRKTDYHLIFFGYFDLVYRLGHRFGARTFKRQTENRRRIFRSADRPAENDQPDFCGCE